MYVYLLRRCPRTGGLRDDIVCKSLNNFKFKYLRGGQVKRSRFRRRGGGCKRLVNYYDMERRSVKGSARVFSLITLQRHYRCLALVKYWTGGWSYILGVEGLGRGIIVQNCGDSRSNAGSLAEIGRLMPGTFVCNIP